MLVGVLRKWLGKGGDVPSGHEEDGGELHSVRMYSSVNE